MTSSPAPAVLRRRHLVGGGRTWKLADLLVDAGAEARGPVLVLTLDYAAVSLGSVTRRLSGLVGWALPGGGGVVVGLDRSGRPCLEVGEDPGSVETATAPHPVRPGYWHRYTLAVGADTVALHVDGRLVASVRLSGARLPPVTAVELGGRHDSARLEGSVAVESATGILADASLAASDDHDSVSAALRENRAPDLPALDLAAELGRWRRDDPWRPVFHFQPPSQWMNEPHAPIEVDGLHHLFFQSNRTGAHWGGIEWGHAVSTDLVRWRHLPPALSPVDSPVAPDGVWSGGSVLDDSGQPLLFFTSGDVRCHPNQAVAVARPHGRGMGTTWVADPEPVLRMPSRNDLVPGQFRDPFVWRENDAWFMLVGAGVAGRGGTALLFESSDGETWSEVGPLLVADAVEHPEVGEMFELPVLLPLSTPSGRRAHVLVVCPWWAAVPDGRVVEVVHWVGDWDAQARSFRPWHPEPRRFDSGRHFTGPSGTVLSDGRTILWSIAQDGRTTTQQAAAGWAHNAGLPLELSLGEDDTLRIAPVRELATLREELLVDLDGGARGDGDAAIPPRTDHAAGLVAEIPLVPLELEVRLAAGEGTVTIEIVHGATDHLHASIELDCATGRLEARRPEAQEYDIWSPTELDGATVQPLHPPTHLRVFLDGSMLEAYVGDRASLTTRVRPPADARVRVRVPVDAGAWRVRCWRLGSADITPAAEPFV